MTDYGFLSVIPVSLAVTIAIKYKNVVLALFASVLTGIAPESPYRACPASAVG